jgi:electron transport complex protein RnfE
MGIGFTLALVALGSVREILGNGTLFGISVLGEGYLPFLVIILPPGAFLTLGFMLGMMNKIETND